MLFQIACSGYDAWVTCLANTNYALSSIECSMFYSTTPSLCFSYAPKHVVVIAHALLVSLAPSTSTSSFSHGFFRFGLVACVPCPSSTVGGISLIPGTGFPLVIKSTMCAKLVGYGAGGSFALMDEGRMPLGSVVGAGAVLFAVVFFVDLASVCSLRVECSSWSMTEDASTLVELGGVGGGRLRALR